MQLPQSAARGQGASTASWSGLRVLSLAAAADGRGAGSRRSVTGGQPRPARGAAAAGGGTAWSHGGRRLPSEVDVLGEDEGAHDGDDDHHEGAEGGGEDGAPALHHQPLHVVGDARRHYALHTEIPRSASWHDASY